MATAKQREAEEAVGRLREWLKPGDEVYTILRHVSRSGMSRAISIVAIDHDEEPGRIYDLDYNVAKALGYSVDRDRGGVKVSGAGMDMGFHIVYNLGRVLFPDGFGCIGEGNGTHGTRCPSNDHSNGDRDYTPHAEQFTADACPGKPCGADCDHRSGEGAPHWHRDGGYALRHRWL